MMKKKTKENNVQYFVVFYLWRFFPFFLTSLWSQDQEIIVFYLFFIVIFILYFRFYSFISSFGFHIFSLFDGHKNGKIVFVYSVVIIFLFFLSLCCSLKSNLNENGNGNYDIADALKVSLIN